VQAENEFRRASQSEGCTKKAIHLPKTGNELRAMKAGLDRTTSRKKRKKTRIQRFA
jgi:hypothetical protein